jgi:Bacteriophage Gp15 protein
MSFLLTDDFSDSFEWHHKSFFVDMSFDNILRIFQMFQDDLIADHRKMTLAIQMLVINESELEFSDFDEIPKLFSMLMKRFLDIDVTKKSEDGKQTKTFDYEKDAELIYASFFAVYKIDLFEMQGKLHWKKFNALLSNLNDESPLKKVIGYRTMKIPSSKEASKEYISHIRKMKRIYSLEEDDTQLKVDEGFNTIAAILKGRAVTKNG